MKQTYNTSTSKVDVTGDYANLSKYIRISDIVGGLSNGTLGVDLVPWGHAVYSSPINGQASTLSPEFFWQQDQVGDDGEINTKIYPGTLNNKFMKFDLLNYLFLNYKI